MQLDRSGRDFFTDSRGETQIIPEIAIDALTGTPVTTCNGGSDTISTGYGTCLHPDTSGSGYYQNVNLLRDARGELERHNLFMFVNHEMKSGNEMYLELGRYSSDYQKNKESGGIFSVQKFNINQNYWAQQIEDATGADVNRKWFVDGWRPSTCLLYTSPSPRD